MNILELNSKGKEVKKWQLFLIGNGYTKVTADGDFGPITEKATKDFQKQNGLTPDGKVGNYTLKIAIEKGFALFDMVIPVKSSSASFPVKPNFNPLATSQMKRIFGSFDYTAKSDGSINMHGHWEKENIISIEIPQLTSLPPYFPKKIKVHQRAAQQFINLFNAWEKAGLLPNIISYSGCYNPRLVRGGTDLSRHSWGTAFDINAEWNGLNVIPPKRGEKGSVLDLVKIANDHGFYWGGHFPRLDGMHFEIAQLF
jgi:hypothetical protein